jgi:hypothetical protein
MLDESAQSRLFGFCDDEEFHADALRSAPTDSSIFYLERDGLSRELQE